MTKREIRDLVITGSYMIGDGGMKEPASGWEGYANRLEDVLIQNNRSLPNIDGVVCPSCGTGDVIYRFKTNSFICHQCVDVEWGRSDFNQVKKE